MDRATTTLATRRKEKAPTLTPFHGGTNSLARPQDLTVMLTIYFNDIKARVAALCLGSLCTLIFMACRQAQPWDVLNQLAIIVQIAGAVIGLFFLAFGMKR